LEPNERRGAGILFSLMFLGMLLETAGIGLIIPALVFITQADIGNKYQLMQVTLDFLGNPNQKELVVGSMTVLASVYIVKTIFLTYLSWRQASFVYDIQDSLSRRTFKGYVLLPYTFHLQRNSAQLIRNTINEVGLFVGAINAAATLLTEALVLFGIAILLIIIEPIGTSLIILVLMITAYVYNFFTKNIILNWGRLRQTHEGERIKHLQQGLHSFKDLKILGREAEFIKIYSIHNAMSAKMSKLMTFIQSIPRIWLEFLAVLSLSILVIGITIKGNEFSTILPILGVFAASAFRLIPSLYRSMSNIQTLRYSIPVVTLLEEELGLFKKEKIEKSTEDFEFHESITLRDVSFIYPDTDKEALEDINLQIDHGSKVGIAGKSGSGKSTLVDIILGLLPVKSGKVAVDGKDIRTNIRGWQNIIGYVPQSVYLTDDTLKRNIAFGIEDENINEESIKRAIELSQLKDFSEGLSDGLDTIIGERGVKLSGGQKQRIGIARALYHRPKILALDEATSALDQETEEKIINEIFSNHADKTIIIITHRFASIKGCDKIFKVQEGRIYDE
jgi:ATP-binding cassette, subfamily B, bacterial PglK